MRTGGRDTFARPEEHFAVCVDGQLLAIDQPIFQVCEPVLIHRTLLLQEAVRETALLLPLRANLDQNLTHSHTQHPAALHCIREERRGIRSPGHKRRPDGRECCSARKREFLNVR